MEAEDERCCDSPVGPCPSFNAYSADSIYDAAIGASGEEEAEIESGIASIDLIGEDNQERSDDDFEFVSLVKNPGQVSIGGGWTGPVFPVFNRDLVFGVGKDPDRDQEEEEDERPMRIPLKNLFMVDRDLPSCSSSEADELETVPEGTYCVWTPRPSATPSPNCCKKSNSTGSGSKRWRFRDLLKRSNSDGKDAFVFLTPSSSSSSAKLVTSITASPTAKEISRNPTAAPEAKVGEKSSKKAAAKVSAHEEFYVRNRALKEEDKKRSYLPYRKDLVGFFANVNSGGNGWGRTFPPF